MQLQLMALALSGNSPVSNAFTEEADRLGLTEKGRERKEREEQKRFSEQMEALREQTKQFQEQMDRLDQACAEALLENDEKLRIAREELDRIREHAYEITMPDGTVAKVYRDGDTVRNDGGEEISQELVKPADVSDDPMQWTHRKEAKETVDRLEQARQHILQYQQKIEVAKERQQAGGLSGEDLEKATAELKRAMPDEVRSKFEERKAGMPPEPVQRDAADADPALRSGIHLTSSFARGALNELAAELNQPNDEITQPRPAVSTPAPK